MLGYLIDYKLVYWIFELNVWIIEFFSYKIEKRKNFIGFENCISFCLMVDLVE